MKALAHALYFGILGSYLGGIFVAAAVRSDASNFATQLMLAFIVGIGIWPFAVLFGGIPAATTGLIYWTLKKRTKMIALGRIRVALIMFLVGGVCAGIFWLVVAQSSPKKVFDAFVFFVFPGGGASAICALLLQPSAPSPNKALAQDV